VRLDFLPFGTSSSVTDEVGVQPFHLSAPQHGTYSEGQTLSGPSTSRYQESHIPVVQDSQESVKCTWPGCSRVVRKDGYNRHVDETHLRKVKAVCARCGRAFSRIYMKKNHELTCRGRK
jgi:hypothetical protein